MKTNINITEHNILVVGDVMLDTYYIGDVSRISPEAPVPVFKKQNERNALGGAANVALNLIAGNQKVTMMAVTGNDEAGNTLKQKLSDYGINTTLLLSLDRQTTEKTRFLASNNQQVLRLDIEDTFPITKNDLDNMINLLNKQINDYELIVLSDYMKGLLTLELTQAVICLARERNIPVIVDVKDTNYLKYYGATLLKPNLKELQLLTSMEVDSDDEIIKASEFLRKECGCKYILTTCGAKGMVLVGDNNPYFIQAVGQDVFDVTGAGDTTIAYLATCLVNGLDIKDAVDIANFAAGIQVSKVGTSAVFLNEIREKLADQNNEINHKVIYGEQLDSFRKDHAGKKIVFTNGCFDILHIGHVHYLQEAAKLGDILIIGLNSDSSVRRLKGAQRPINSESERAEILSALSFVDYITIFDEDTPLELIKKIEPDVLVKGGDYHDKYVVGTNEVLSRGGSLVLIPFVEGKSTSNIIKRINEKQDSDNEE